MFLQYLETRGDKNMNNYFEFDTKAKILSGDGALSHIPYELRARNKKKPFVLSDKGLEKIGLVEKSLKLINFDCEYTLFLDVPTDSSIEIVNKATEIYKKEGCDCVIAIGGGSVIDTAKGVVLSLVSGESDLAKLQGADFVRKNNEVLFIAVPSTAGTGSEMTSVAVIKDAKTQLKLEYISTFIMPDISVIDPVMTLTLPPKITASTAIDALTHSIEAYSCLMKNPVSDAYAVCAIKLINENLLKVIEDGKNSDARLALANAANIAGAAFSNSMVGAVHAIGHALGAVCGVAHGDAMGVLLPHVLELNYEKCKNHYEDLLFFTNKDVFMKNKEEEHAKLFIEEIKNLLKTLNEKTGLPITLEQTGKVVKGQFEMVVEKALADGASIVNPVPLNKERIFEVLNKAF